MYLHRSFLAKLNHPSASATHLPTLFRICYNLSASVLSLQITFLKPSASFILPLLSFDTPKSSIRWILQSLHVVLLPFLDDTRCHRTCRGTPTTSLKSWKYWSRLLQLPSGRRRHHFANSSTHVISTPQPSSNYPSQLRRAWQYPKLRGWLRFQLCDERYQVSI